MDAQDGGVMSWSTNKQSSDYAPAVAIYPDGKTRAGNVAVRNISDADTARVRHAAGETVWVRREDVDAVTGTGVQA